MAMGSKGLRAPRNQRHSWRERGRGGATGAGGGDRRRGWGLIRGWLVVGAEGQAVGAGDQAVGVWGKKDEAASHRKR